ncbi:MAG: S8 family serine peptidase [Desulfitobacteriaceae bacterium]
MQLKTWQKVFSVGISLTLLVSVPSSPIRDRISPRIQPNEDRVTNINVDGRIVVKLAPGVDPHRIAQLVGAQLIRRGSTEYVTLKFNDRNVTEKIEELKRIPGVLGAERSRLLRISSTSSVPVVSDSKYSWQWGLNAANVTQAWATGANGSGITIAVVDTGIDMNHPDLKDNLVPGYNPILNTANSLDLQDHNGHGTHVAGIAAAELNGIGIVGVAYKAKIMPIKAMDKDGEGADDDIATGVRWAADHGANIINLSLGSDSQEDVLQSAIQYAQTKGCLVVAAAGNYASGSNPGVAYPAADNGVLAVTAVDENDLLADFSDTGPQVALAAPGVDIISDFWQNRLGSGYMTLSGTSMASPFVAGVAALVWSQHRDWTAQQVRIALVNGAVDLGDSGRDSSFGYGLINAYRSLAISAPSQSIQSPAALSFAGGTIQGADSGVSLKVPPLAFRNTQTISLNTVNSPGNFPSGIIPGGSAFSIQWSGGNNNGIVVPNKILTLTINQQPPTGPKMLGYVFHWSGTRWIEVGGGSTGLVSVGIYEPGVYRLGYVVPSQSSRIAGNDRVATAIQIAEAAFPTGADTVILARADNFPDALAGVPLAYKLHAPILLTNPLSLAPTVWAEINKLSPKKAILLGGTGAIAQNIENQLRSIAQVQRLSGVNRYATAASIAQALGTVGQVVIVNGENFPDALAIASVAAQMGEPILLTPTHGLAPETDQALRQLSVSESLAIGGEGVISSSTFQALPSSQRLWGADRYGTAAAVLQKFPVAGAQIYVATGEDFPDALSGGVLAAVQSTEIILVPPTGPTSAQTAIVQSWQGRKAIALGGLGAVPDAALAGI